MKTTKAERILDALDKAAAPLAWLFEGINEMNEENKELARLAIGTTAALALLSHIINTIF